MTIPCQHTSPVQAMSADAFTAESAAAAEPIAAMSSILFNDVISKAPSILFDNGGRLKTAKHQPSRRPRSRVI